MDEQEPPLGIPIIFVKGEGEQRKQVQFKRYKDNSAYIQGDEEIIFEGTSSEAPWLIALRYLENHGYKKVV